MGNAIGKLQEYPPRRRRIAPATDFLAGQQQRPDGIRAVGIPGQHLVERVGGSRQVACRQSRPHGLIQNALEQIRPYLRHLGELLDDRLVGFDRARVVCLVKPGVRQPGVSHCLVWRYRQAFHRSLESGLSFRHSAFPPITSSQVEVRLPEERALRKLLRQRLKGLPRQAEAVGHVRRIGRGNEHLVGARGGFVLTEPQLPQHQQRQVRRSRFRMLREKPLQHLCGFRDIVAGQIQFADLQQRLALALGRGVVGKILLVSRGGVFDTAQLLEQAGLERGALGSQVALRGTGRHCQEVGCALQRRFRPPVGNLDAA